MKNDGLSITHSHVGPVCVVTLDGRIDSTNADELMLRLKGLFDTGEKNVLVDFGCSPLPYERSVSGVAGCD